MAGEIVEIERRGAIALLTLNDPARLNAMTEAMGRGLESAVAELRGSDSLRAVVLSGAGRAFSAGGDLKMLARMGEADRSESGEARRESREANRAAMSRFYRLFLCIRELPQPCIAALNGHAIGAGCCVALACDLRIAAREAKLGLNFTRLGIHPGMGATWMLPRLIGPARAAELLYTGRLVSGAEAERMGLVSRALPRDEVLESALALAEEIAACAPLAVRGVKRSLAASEQARLDEQLDAEAREQSLCYESADLAEGLRAIREKRAPSFSGR